MFLPKFFQPTASQYIKKVRRCRCSACRLPPRRVLFLSHFSVTLPRQGEKAMQNSLPQGQAVCFLVGFIVLCSYIEIIAYLYRKINAFLRHTSHSNYHFREQDKEWGKFAVTRQIFTLSERFAKWDAHLAKKDESRPKTTPITI